MAKRDTVKQIVALAEANDITVTVSEEMTVSELNVALETLKKDIEAKVEKETPAAEKKRKFIVAKGKSLTTPRGMKNEGERIRYNDVFGGVEKLETLAAKGYVKEVK